MPHPTKEESVLPELMDEPPQAIPSTAPSRGNADNTIKETEKLRAQKLRLADGSSSPAVISSPVESPSRIDNNKDHVKEGQRNDKLRLAAGATTTDMIGETLSSTTKKVGTRNQLRLASGHEGESDTAPAVNKDKSIPDDGQQQDPLKAEVAETVDVEALLDQRLPTATVTKEDTDEELDGSSRRKRLAWRVFFVLFAIAVGGSIIAAILVLTRQKEADSSRSNKNFRVVPTLTPTPVPTLSFVPSYSPSSSPTSRMSWIKGLLEPFVEDTTPWDDNTTVQFEALQWMEDNWWVPNTTDDTEVELAMVQRYGAFVVFLGLAGEQEKAIFSDFAALDTCLWAFAIGFDDSAGLFCTDGKVTEVDFYQIDLPEGFVFEIGGTIPTEIGLLSSLRWLGIDNNLISGTLPSELFRLSKLESLLLPNNLITGTLPDMRLTTSLLEVELSNNLLSGQIDHVMNPNLLQLYLWNNNLSGALPIEIGALTALSGLDLYGNALEGPIPDEIQHMTSLSYFAMGKNALDQSTIPVGIGQVTLLTSLTLSDTQVSGTIPSEIGRLTLLTTLQLWKNQLNGSIPDSLKELTKLTSLGLSSNALTGTIPTELGLLTDLNHLNLNTNELEGALPSELGLLTGLDLLSVSKNPGITGAVPETLQNLTRIQDAYFQHTSLTSGLESLFCGLSLDDFRSDCGSTNPEINCECCTVCCSASGTSCRYA